MTLTSGQRSPRRASSAGIVSNAVVSVYARRTVPRLSALCRLRSAGGAVCRRERALGLGKEHRALRSERYVAWVALEQRHAERALERGDLLADGLLSDVQLCPRA